MIINDCFKTRSHQVTLCLHASGAVGTVEKRYLHLPLRGAGWASISIILFVNLLPDHAADKRCDDNQGVIAE